MIAEATPGDAPAVSPMKAWSQWLGPLPVGSFNLVQHDGSNVVGRADSGEGHWSRSLVDFVGPIL
jgi:hypothetical protein